jgi:glycosyltransferase involved in cell wall biosynthesis
MTVVCLLPVRNGEADLPGFLESAARVADCVIALDDGSTDGTGDLLRASPLVERVIENPRRETSHGWHDGENRNRLLRACDDLAPEWVLSLDVDDRIAEDDAAALRGFLAGDALPGLAYGFPYVRMWRGRTDPVAYAVWRLFSWEPGQEFTRKRNHNQPVPTAISLQRWVLTTIRIQHWGVSDEERWEARQRKYREASGPGAGIPTDFGGLDRHGGDDWPEWTSRPAGLPVLAAAAGVAQTEDFF